MSLEHLRGEPGGREWLARLSLLVAACAERWRLQVGAPFAGATASFAAPATRADGSVVVLKVGFPHEESAHEADALALWHGAGAVRLLASDRATHALLLERCEPGSQASLLAPDDEADAVAGVLARLWQPPPAAHPFALVAETAARWLEQLPRRWQRLAPPLERAVLDLALAALRDLPPTQPELVVCHQDLHGGDVLRARRQPWLAIDPKPIVAERAFDCASLLRNRPSRRVLERLADALELDRERVRGWAVAHALAWGLEETRFHAANLEAAQALAKISW